MGYTVKIFTTHQTAQCDVLLTDLVSGDRAIHAPQQWLAGEIDSARILDAEGQSCCDALVILGRELEAEVLSACDLGGVRVLGLIGDAHDEERLDHLRLRERLSLPLHPEELAAALGLSSWSESPHGWKASERHAPVDTVTSTLLAVNAVTAEESRYRLDPIERTTIPHVTSHRGGSRNHVADTVVERVTGSVIAIWGAKGSPGVTATALSLAAVAAASGRRAVLVDADVHGAAVATLCDIVDEAPGIVALSRAASRGNLDRDTVRRYTVPVARGRHSFDVVTGITDARRWPEIEPDQIERVLDVLSHAYDAVIVDVGFSLESDEDISSDPTAPARNGATLACLRRADRVVAVTTPDPVGLSRHLLVLPRLREITDATPVVTCVNRVREKTRGFASASAVRDALQRFADVPNIIAIPEDTDTLRRSVSAATPAPWVGTRGPWLQAVTKLWEDASA